MAWRRIFSIGCALAATLMAAPAHANDGTIRIGVTLRMISDEGQRIGQMVVDQFAEVNKQGGIDGHKVEVTLLNDECDPAVGVSNAFKLISSAKVDLLIGSTCSSVTLPIVDISARAKVPLIIPSSTAASITEKHSAWVFRVPISERFYNAVIGKYVGDYVGKKVAYLWTTDAASRSFAVNMINFMKKTYSIAPLFKVQVNEQDIDYRSTLLKIKALNPDALALAGTPAELARMVAQAKEVGIPSRVVRVASSNADVTTFPQLAGDNADGVIFSAAFSPFDQRPIVRRFVAMTKVRYGVSLPDHDFSQAWDLVQILKEALRRAHLKVTADSLAADRTAIRDALENIHNYEGLAAGPISFCAAPTPECRDGNRSPLLIEYTKGGSNFAEKVITHITFPANFDLK